MLPSENDYNLLEFIIERVNVGILVLDQDMKVTLWNRFMVNHSNLPKEEIIGKNIFDVFPELPQKWLSKKIKSVFELKNYAFISAEQRPYVFKFCHNRLLATDIEYMSQDITLIPIKDAKGKVERVCLTLFDVTDVSLYQNKLKNAMTKLTEFGRVDGLTKTYNRTYWEKRLSEEFERTQRYGQLLTLIMFDLDHFKKINDSHGHLAGDEVLKQVVTVVKNTLREEIDIMGRFGGEEFGIYLPCTDVAGATIVAKRICFIVANHHIFFKDIEMQVSTSIGIAGYSKKMKSYDFLLDCADEALYAAKKNGRNRYEIYEE